MSWPSRLILSAIVLTSWVTGVTFFILNNYVQIDGEFGPQKHPAQFLFLKIHGASAFAMMISFGYLLATHVPIGYRAKRERILGLLLTGVQALLVVSAYYLYYGSDEDRRSLVAWTHLSLGVIYPFIIALHVVFGKNNRKNKKRLR